MEKERAVPAEAAEEIQGQDPAEEGQEEAAQESAEQASGEDQPSAPRKKSAQGRIDEITRARREAEREREYWKQVALAKEQAIRQQTQPQQPQNPLFPPRPTLDQFETTSEYEDALLTWHETRKEITSRAAQQQQAQMRAAQVFSERAQALRKEHDDFDEVIEAPVFSQVMRVTLMNSENGPEVAYHLGLPQNRAEADRIRNLPMELQPYELGKLETKLLIAKQTKKVPSAPPPIKPVGMSGQGGAKDPSKMTIDEWMAWDRQKQLDKLKAKYGGT